MGGKLRTGMFITSIYGVGESFTNLIFSKSWS
jgi:hypothetical protein